MKFISFLLFAIGFVSASWTQQEYLEHPIDVIDYDVSLELFEEHDTIFVLEAITFRMEEACDSFFVDLESIHEGKGMQLQSPVKCDGYIIESRHENNRIWLYPNETWVGQEKKLLFYFSGVPKTGLIIGENKFSDRTYFGDNWPNRAHHWFACVDHPSDKATISFNVLTPATYQVIATGDFISRKGNDSGEKMRYSYSSKIPLPTKVMVIGVANFMVDLYTSNFDFDVTAWVYPEDKEKGLSDMEVSVEVLDYFIKLIGDYPFEKLANVQSTTQFGGMENAGNIFYDENAIQGDGSMEALIAHEIAHQWFGNSASEMDWPHLWLSEGFATYLTDLYWENKYGTEAMNERLINERNRVIGFSKQYDHPVVDTEYAELMHLLNPNSYQKGAWVLHMLRTEVGDEAFLKGIKAYHDNYRLSNADSEDFKAIMESVSDQNLDAFFKQWLYNSGHPILLIESEIKNKTAEISITQTQEGPGFQFDLEIEIIYNSGNSEIISIPVSGKKTKHTFEATSKITGYRFDPNVKLLFEEIAF